jgi:hypothetical protein
VPRTGKDSGELAHVTAVKTDQIIFRPQPTSAQFISLFFAFQTLVLTSVLLKASVISHLGPDLLSLPSRMDHSALSQWRAPDR